VVINTSRFRASGGGRILMTVRERTVIVRVRAGHKVRHVIIIFRIRVRHEVGHFIIHTISRRGDDIYDVALRHLFLILVKTLSVPYKGMNSELGLLEARHIYPLLACPYTDRGATQSGVFEGGEV
jgi:hypothetical protein